MFAACLCRVYHSCAQCCISSEIKEDGKLTNTGHIKDKIRQICIQAIFMTWKTRIQYIHNACVDTSHPFIKYLVNVDYLTVKVA